MNKKINSILVELRFLIEEFYRDRLERVILFGSQARDEGREGSDIDIMVVLNGEVNSCKEIDDAGDLIAKMSLENDTVISCVFVSLDRYLYEKSPLLLNVRREGVTL